MKTTHPRRTRRAITAAALAVTSVLGLAPAASAETVFTPDRVGDVRSELVDLTSLRVDHRPQRVLFRVRYVDDPEVGIPRNTDVWIDTGGSAAPDRVVVLRLEVDPRFAVHRTSGFGQVGRATCRLRNVEYAAEPGLMTFEVPRSCLGDPARIRTSLRNHTDISSGDWIPAARTFGPWVRRGAV